MILDEDDISLGVSNRYRFPASRDLVQYYGYKRERVDRGPGLADYPLKRRAAVRIESRMVVRFTHFNGRYTISSSPII